MSARRQAINWDIAALLPGGSKGKKCSEDWFNIGEFLQLKSFKTVVSNTAIWLSNDDKDHALR